MRFEFNKEKSAANQQKHGINLAQATELWATAYVTVAARTVGEPRWMVIGRRAGGVYACIYTLRGEVLRLISCRRASKKEARLYHASFQETPEETEDDVRSI